MKAKFISFIALFFAIVTLLQCKKSSVTPLADTRVTGTALVDAKWTFDKPHSNVSWETKYYDFSQTMLKGRFNNFSFFPKFQFNESNLSTCSINTWVQLSSFDSGEPGRDGPGKCGRSYLGVTYLDTAKKEVDPASDTAWFRSTSVLRSGNGYVVKGTFAFNRYRSPSGYPDGTRIIKPVTMYLTYNGMKDFDSNGDGTKDMFRAGFSGSFVFRRSDYMDVTSTQQWIPVPTVSETVANTIAVKNKTYGVWTQVVGDSVYVNMHMQFYKNH